MFIVARPQISESEISPIRSKFTIEPLEPGFGYTVGNSLRRTLLSSIPGAAISSVRIDGVLHEFSTIPKVNEDVTDIILNLKELVIRSDVEEPTTVYLKSKGPAEVTAGDVAPPAGIEISNPDLHLATLGKGASLEMELTVERGVGYRMADKNKKPRDPIGVIPVDSIFSPVRKVSYAVEDTRVEQMTDRDRLILDVETDGSVTPREALASAGGTLLELVQLFSIWPRRRASRSVPQRTRTSRATTRSRSRTSTSLFVRTTASSERASTPWATWCRSRSPS